MDEWFSLVFKSDSPLKSLETTMVVGSNIKIKGDMRFNEPFDTVMLYGQIQGRIIPPSNGKGRVIINDSGIYYGDIVGILAVAINGKVIGDLCVDTVYLGSNAVVHGNVMCRSLTMDRSAILVGHLSVSKDLDVGIDAYKAAAFIDSKEIESIEEREINEVAQSSDTFEPLGKIILLVLLPQSDFYSKNSESGEALFSEFMKKQVQSIDAIYITLDSHQKMDIGHSTFWTDRTGRSHPEVYSRITKQDVLENIWRPKIDNMQEYCMEVFSQRRRRQDGLNQLKENAEFVTIHEEHCLIGTQGAALVPAVNESVNLWVESRSKNVTYIHRRGILPIERREATEEGKDSVDDGKYLEWNLKFLESLSSNDTLVVCGRASAACSEFRLTNILSAIPSIDSQERPRVSILSDVLWFDPSDEEGEAILDTMEAQGAEICTTLTFRK